MGGDHPCPVCKATFTRPQHVARHMRSHTGDRPYKCQQCGDQFARSDLLSRHVNKCHSNTAGTVNGRGQAAKLNDPGGDDKRRACDQCNHSKVRCDFGVPCSKCVQRKTICTYAKPPRKNKKGGDMYASDASSTSANSSMYDLSTANMQQQMGLPQGVPMQYMNPQASYAPDYGLPGQSNMPMLFAPGSGDFLAAPRNLYDAPSPNAPSLTMSVSTLDESAGSSPDTNHLGSSPGMVNSKSSGRARALTVPTVNNNYMQPGMPGYDSGTMAPRSSSGIGQQQQQSYPAGSVLPNAMAQHMSATNGNGLQHSMDMNGNWNYIAPNGAYLPNGSAQYPPNVLGLDSHRFQDPSSIPANAGLGDWNQGNAATSNVQIGSLMYPSSQDTTLTSGGDGMLPSSIGDNMFSALGGSSPYSDYSRPTTSDGGFSSALDGLTLNDPNMPAVYQQFMNTNLPYGPLPDNLPTGQTPDLWAQYMAVPLGSETPAAISDGTPNQLSDSERSTPMKLAEKGFRPQLLSRLSKRSSMPNLVTPFGSGATPRGYPPPQDNTRMLAQPAQQVRTPDVKFPVVPPSVADAESLKSYQQACLARAAPVLKFSPRVKSGRSPTNPDDHEGTNLARTLGIQQQQQQSPTQNNAASRSRTTSTSSTASVKQQVAPPLPSPSRTKAYAYMQGSQQRVDARQAALHASGLPAFSPNNFPTLSSQTRFLSQSLLAQESHQRPSNKRLPSTTLGPENSKRAVFHHVGETNDSNNNEYALFDDDAQGQQVPNTADRRRRQSAPSTSPPTVRPASNAEKQQMETVREQRQRVVSDATTHFQPRLQQPIPRAAPLVNHVVS